MELYEVVGQYAQENGIDRFEAHLIDDVLIGWAQTYAQTYTGNFAFMVDMQRQATGPNGLSKGMAKGVLNCALAEWRYRGPSKQEEVIKVEVDDSQPIEQAVPNGTYTVVFADGDYRTLRVSDDFRPESPEGSQMVSFLSGPDNSSDFTGFAFLSGERLSVWKRYSEDTAIVNAAKLLLEDWEEAGYAYALQSGNCFRCGRKLTVPASITRGLGPVCAEKLGVAA